MSLNAIQNAFKIQAHQLFAAALTGSIAAALLISGVISREGEDTALGKLQEVQKLKSNQTLVNPNINPDLCAALIADETQAKSDIKSNHADTLGMFRLGGFFTLGTALVLSPVCRSRRPKPAPAPAG